MEYTQLYASRYLQLFLWKPKVAIIVMCINFCDINIPIMAGFKLPTWWQWTQSWEEKLTVGSGQPVRVSCSMSLTLFPKLFVVMHAHLYEFLSNSDLLICIGNLTDIELFLKDS